MDVTVLARSLLEPIPAHRTAGLEVLRAADGVAEVSLLTPPGLTNVIDSLHSSGLITLADAAGLAAIIAACEAEDEFRGVVPLGATATLEFRAPGPRAAGGHLPPDRHCAAGAAAGAVRAPERPGSAPWPTSPTRRTRSCAGAPSSGASAAPSPAAPSPAGP